MKYNYETPNLLYYMLFVARVTDRAFQFCNSENKGINNGTSQVRGGRPECREEGKDRNSY